MGATEQHAASVEGEPQLDALAIFLALVLVFGSLVGAVRLDPRSTADDSDRSASLARKSSR